MRFTRAAVLARARRHRGRLATCTSSTRRCRRDRERRFGALYTLLDNKYYFDRFNDWFFAGGARAARHVGLWKVGDAA